MRIFNTEQKNMKTDSLHAEIVEAFRYFERASHFVQIIISDNILEVL